MNIALLRKGKRRPRSSLFFAFLFPLFLFSLSPLLIQLDPTVRHEEKGLLHGLVDEHRSVVAADDARDFPRTQLAHAIVEEQRVLRACPGPPVQFCFHFLQPRDLRLGFLLRLVEDPPYVRF